MGVLEGPLGGFVSSLCLYLLWGLFLLFMSWTLALMLVLCFGFGFGAWHVPYVCHLRHVPGCVVSVGSGWFFVGASGIVEGGVGFDEFVVGVALWLV